MKQGRPNRDNAGVRRGLRLRRFEAARAIGRRGPVGPAGPAGPPGVKGDQGNTPELVGVWTRADMQSWVESANSRNNLDLPVPE